MGKNERVVGDVQEVLWLEGRGSAYLVEGQHLSDELAAVYQGGSHAVVDLLGFCK